MAFFEFNIAMSGLFAAQRGLGVTSNNISNANTTGYSRQVLNQKADTPLSGIGVGMTGTGVATTSVTRVRDSYLDQKLWGQNAKLGEYNVKVTQNSVVESVFGEPSDAGFTKVFNNMFNTMDDLSKNPSSGDNKIAVREELISFAKYYNNIGTSLENYRKDLNYEIKAQVKEINTLATRIQSLNKQIFEAEMYGDDANSFRDERDNCIDRLSEIVDVEAHEVEVNIKGNVVKQYSVKIAGQELVNHLQMNTLKVTPDADGYYQIEWDNALRFDMADANMSGELKGLIDMRDGGGSTSVNGITYNGIPYYIDQLNSYVRIFAQTLNEEYSKNKEGYVEVNQPHADGITHIKRDGDQIAYYKYDDTTDQYNEVNAATLTDTTYAPKYALFTHTTGDSTGKPVSASDLNDYNEITADNFFISAELFESASNIRGTYNEDEESDGSLWSNVAGQKDNKKMFDEGDPKDYMVSIFSQLGINAQESQMYLSTQTSVTNNIKNQRLAVSQVDVTEEFTNLIKYQQAYQAAAKIMNTIDGIYETTIFKLGNF